MPSTILQFWDLGGQRDIRSIWPKYYDECHAIVYVVDAADEKRLEEGWEVFGRSTVINPNRETPYLTPSLFPESVLTSPQTRNLPLLLLANKQDSPQSLSSTDIRESYERWSQARVHASRKAETEDPGDASGADVLGGGLKAEPSNGLEARGGSLEVLGVSALDGFVQLVWPVS